MVCLQGPIASRSSGWFDGKRKDSSLCNGYVILRLFCIVIWKNIATLHFYDVHHSSIPILALVVP